MNGKAACFLNRSKVAIVKVAGEDIREAIRKALLVIGQPKIKPHGKVVIKPNLCKLVSSDLGATTDVKVVDAMIQVVREIEPTSAITVVESDSTIRGAKEAFMDLGYFSLQSKHNVKLLNLSEDEQVRSDALRNLSKGPATLARTLTSCDYLISMAKLKTHPFERVSCILKNHWGCISDREKVNLHSNLPQILATMMELARPNLCIIDGIMTMEGKGPVSGAPKRTNLIIVGEDPVSVDVVASKIMGINPMSVPHLKYAAAHHVGNASDIEIVGEGLKDAVRSFRAPSYVEFLCYRFGFLLIRSLPKTMRECMVKVINQLEIVLAMMFRERIIAW
jgi:uncharacterized protein (DUF362 family)